MKNYTAVFILSTLSFCACKKSHTNPSNPINTTMEKDFNFKPGSYWIYRDSVSGATDSAYVYANTTKSSQLGCAFTSGQPYFDIQTISIHLVSDTGASYSEVWTVSMVDSTFSLSLYNNKDSVESQLNLQPFTFPFSAGNSTLIDGCLLYMDSACVSNISPYQSFQNTAVLNHTSRTDGSYPALVYNDCFYLSPGVGFVKMVFNHPTENVYRVLQLQRYKIAE